MPAKPCLICRQSAHPVAGEWIPDSRRDAVAVTMYKFMRREIRTTRNTTWHAVQDALRDTIIFGTGHVSMEYNPATADIDVKVVDCSWVTRTHV